MKIAKKIPKNKAFVKEDNEKEIEETVKNQNQNPPDYEEEERVIEAFKNFDLDGDGSISVREFISMMTNYSTNLNKSDINDIINECKLDVKGSINYRDFVYFWNRMAN